MLLAQVYWYRGKLDRMQKEAEGQYPVLQHLSLKIVVFSNIQYRYLGTGVIGLFNFVGFIIMNNCRCFSFKFTPS